MLKWELEKKKKIKKDKEKKLKKMKNLMMNDVWIVNIVSGRKWK